MRIWTKIQADNSHSKRQRLFSRSNLLYANAYSKIWKTWKRIIKFSRKLVFQNTNCGHKDIKFASQGTAVIYSYTWILCKIYTISILISPDLSLLVDFFYWAKWLATMLALQVRKKTHPRRFDLYNYDAENEPKKLGVLIPDEEIILESPFPEEHLQNVSSVNVNFSQVPWYTKFLITVIKIC